MALVFGAPPLNLPSRGADWWRLPGWSLPTCGEINVEFSGEAPRDEASS